MRCVQQRVLWTDAIVTLYIVRFPRRFQVFAMHPWSSYHRRCSPPATTLFPLLFVQAHRLKNSSSKLSKELISWKRDHTLLLTGTPIQNNTGEQSEAHVAASDALSLACLRSCVCFDHAFYRLFHTR